MESYLFWLLLPVAAASGWFLARLDRKERAASSYELPSEYYRGVNYILNQQPDKAIDLFLKLSEIDKDTAEIHLALGCLFRQRGEVDRAIRVHQSLINRTGLSSSLHYQAMYSLAQDYMSAGLLDRAESLCLELHDASPADVSALNLLKDIYQQEKEWFRAIDVARKIGVYGCGSESVVIAHYYCELAEIGLKKNDMAQVRRMLDKALSEDADCARAVIIQGEIAFRNKNYESAIASFQSLKSQSPEYFGEVLDDMASCYQMLGKKERLITFLQEVLKIDYSVALLLGIAKLLRSEKGYEEALSFLGEELTKKPSLLGMQYMLELGVSDEMKQTQHLGLIKSTLDKLLIDKPVYKCGQCGFTGIDMHWCCPSCKTWASVKPIQEFQWGASV